MKSSSILNMTIAALVFLLFLNTLWNLAWYLSMHDIGYYKRIEVGDKRNFGYNLAIDMILIATFVLQHSGMAYFRRKNTIFSPSLDLDVLNRTVYIACTSISLQLLVKFWKPIDSFTFWDIDTNKRHSWWWLFTLVHAFSWAALYGGFLIMDMPELVGLKQVYYHSKRMPAPILRKSPQLQRLYQHMRHGGLIPLAIILWFHPIMRLDRAILSIFLTGYMLVGFSTDFIDHDYHKIQLWKKGWELSKST